MSHCAKQTSKPHRKLKQQKHQREAFRICSAAVAAFLFTCLIGGQVQASGLLIVEGGFGGRLEIVEQDVRVTINNGIAVTEVNQVFLNTENRIVEALYMFPVPNGASVSNFSMVIAGKEMIGEVVEKERARQIYQSYKKTKRDPGLLEQVDYKTFEMRIFPIGPNAEQQIKVTYYQALDFDHNTATYVYPLATSAKGVEERTTGKFALTLDIKSEIPVSSIVSPSHENEFVVVKHTDEYSRASMEVTAGDLSRDVVVTFETNRPRTGLDFITSKQEGEDGFLMMSLTAGEELNHSNGGMDYVFIVDISGSMRNDGKLALSRNAAKAFIDSLGPEDRYEVIAFNNAPDMLFSELVEVTDQTLEQAGTFLNDQFAKGGTELRPAMTAAYRYKEADRELNVVVLSDGMTTNANEQRELIELINTAPPSSKVFCVGIGNQINRPLLSQLATDAGGLAAFISHGDNFDRQADSFRRKLVHPVATDLRISIDGVEVYDMLPGKLPNLYHGSPLRMVGRYKGQGTAKVNISGVVMGKPFRQDVEIELPGRDVKNPEIDRMWAWYQVQTLMAQERATGQTQTLKDEIVALCEQYSIVSQYASFIVLENDAEYKRWKIQRRNASRIENDRLARKAVQQELARLREQSMTRLGPNKKQSQRLAASEKRVTRSEPEQNKSQPRGPSNRDLDLGFSPVSTRPTTSRNSDGGGGAIDPITGLIAVSMGGAAAWRRRRKRAFGSSDSSGSHVA